MRPRPLFNARAAVLEERRRLMDALFGRSGGGTKGYRLIPGAAELWPEHEARGVRAEEAFRYILGYTCGNEVTLRDLQKKDDQWARAKGFDGSCPLGPWIETDLDPTDVRVETRLNGEVRQAGQTADLAYGVATLIEYITSFMTLLPGDAVLTGTPEGVGSLSPGDMVEVEVDGVGTLSNPVEEGS